MYCRDQPQPAGCGFAMGCFLKFIVLHLSRGVEPLRVGSATCWLGGALAVLIAFSYGMKLCLKVYHHLVALPVGSNFSIGGVLPVVDSLTKLASHL